MLLVPAGTVRSAQLLGSTRLEPRACILPMPTGAPRPMMLQR